MRKTVSPPKKIWPLPDPNDIAAGARQHCVMLARLKIALREYWGFTQQEVAERAGLPLATVRSHEAAGRRSQYLDHILICDALGIDSYSVGFEADRRLRAEGAKPRPWRKESLAAFVSRRCDGRDRITPAEVRRQLRLLARLTLPAKPAPARKRSSPANDPPPQRNAPRRRQHVERGHGVVEAIRPAAAFLLLEREDLETRRREESIAGGSLMADGSPFA